MDESAEDKSEAKERRAEDVARNKTLRTYIRDEYSPKVLDQQGTRGLETCRRLLYVWAPLLDTELKTISAAAVEAVVEVRRRKVRLNTVVREVTMLRAVFRHAVDAGALAANPLSRRQRLAGNIPSDKQVRYLVPDESARLETALDGEADSYYLRVLERLLREPG